MKGEEIILAIFNWADENNIDRDDLAYIFVADLVEMLDKH